MWNKVTHCYAIQKQAKAQGKHARFILTHTDDASVSQHQERLPRRDPQETTHLGMAVSQKALTKNLNGVITHIETDKNVTIGSRVHVPHYNVKEFIIDGIEYAVAKAGDLFAKLEGDAYQPINGYLKVRKCENDHVRGEDDEIVLHMTDKHIEATNWVEIIGVADDCKHITSEDIGMFCVAPESDEKLARILYSKEYMLHESKIEFLTDGE